MTQFLTLVQVFKPLHPHLVQGSDLDNIRSVLGPKGRNIKIISKVGFTESGFGQSPTPAVSRSSKKGRPM